MRTIQDVNRFLDTLAARDAAQVLFKHGDRWTVATADGFLKINHERVAIGAFGSGQLPTASRNASVRP